MRPRWPGRSCCRANRPKFAGRPPAVLSILIANGGPAPPQSPPRAGPARGFCRPANRAHCAAVLRAERAPEPKPSCSACNCSSKLRRERFSACCRKQFVQLLRGVVQLLLNLAQTLLPFLQRAAMRSARLKSPPRRWLKIARSRAGPVRSVPLRAGLFGRKFFQADGVAFLLQIQGGDFVAGAAQLLGGLEGSGLGLAQRLLVGAQLVFHRSARPVVSFPKPPDGIARRRRRPSSVAPPHPIPVGRRAGVPPPARCRWPPANFARPVAQPVLVELDAAFVAFDLTLQLQALLLRLADLLFLFGKLVAQGGRFPFPTRRTFSEIRFDLRARLFRAAPGGPECPPARDQTDAAPIACPRCCNSSMSCL